MRRRPGRPHLQGFAPFAAGALLVVMGAVAGCASDGAEPEPDAGPAPPAFTWVLEPPRGCAVGFSGPTLNPGHAIRQARTRALEQLAAEQLGVSLDSELLIGTHDSIEVTVEEIDGVIANSRIVAMGSGGGAREGLREVYALACPAGTPTPGISSPGYPDWLLNIEARPGLICVPGVGGPTWYPSRQDRAALRDGQDALAAAIEVHIRRRSLDLGQGLARVASESASTERARALANDVDELEDSWKDDDGIGPLGLSGVLYGLVCANVGA